MTGGSSIFLVHAHGGPWTNIMRIIINFFIYHRYFIFSPCIELIVRVMDLSCVYILKRQMNHTVDLTFVIFLSSIMVS